MPLHWQQTLTACVYHVSCIVFSVLIKSYVVLCYVTIWPIRVQSPKLKVIKDYEGRQSVVVVAQQSGIPFHHNYDAEA